MDNLLSTVLQNSNNKNMKNNALLLQQKISQEKINELLEKSSEALMCGPSCQKKKVTDELKQKYLDAETNLKTAPVQLEQSKKNYYIYTEGRPYYDNMLEEELKLKAEKISEMISENFNKELADANTMNSYLNTALINSENTKELLKQYTEKNVEMKTLLRNQHGDILTNDRKTYYETDALNSLKSWYKLLWYIYYLLVIIIIISFLIAQSGLSIFSKVIITISLIFYPYFINYIFILLYRVFSAIYNKLPKNVYNNL
jgi:hypothetical protein